MELHAEIWDGVLKKGRIDLPPAAEGSIIWSCVFDYEFILPWCTCFSYWLICFSSPAVMFHSCFLKYNTMVLGNVQLKINRWLSSNMWSNSLGKRKWKESNSSFKIQHSHPTPYYITLTLAYIVSFVTTCLNIVDKINAKTYIIVDY